MGIFVNTYGDIVTTEPGYDGARLLAYNDETYNRDGAELIAQRLRDVLGKTDTVWYVIDAGTLQRISPLLDSKGDARKWLRTNRAPNFLNLYRVVEISASQIDALPEVVV
jgi:hypothetical protein